MKFTKLTIKDWRQFSEVNLRLHPKMTIITGANGTGKTTILRILAQHFGWQVALLATPKKSKGLNAFQYAKSIFRNLLNSKKSYVFSEPNRIGTLIYSNNLESQLYVPDGSSAAYNIEIRAQEPVEGLHINSHRPVQSYQPVATIPTSGIGAEQAYQVYSSELMQRFNNGYTQFSPIYRMKETLISMAMFGAGNKYVEKNENLEKLFVKFKEILVEILPPSIGFTDISVRVPDVVLITKTGEFMIDAASGGLMSIIDLAWQIFLYSNNKSEFTVILDEPENHLHPSMQRSLLSRLTMAFPQAQFIVATHSPFMVSSIKDSIVHALVYENDGEKDEAGEFLGSRVSSVELDLDTKASTANEILRDVLGVPVTLPQWAENDLANIVGKLNINTLTSESLSNLRTDLASAGLSEYYPEALKMAAGRPQ